MSFLPTQILLLLIYLLPIPVPLTHSLLLTFHYSCLASLPPLVAVVVFLSFAAKLGGIVIKLGMMAKFVDYFAVAELHEPSNLAGEVIL